MASTRLLRVLQTSALSRVAVARICPTASGNIARPHPSSNQSDLLKCFGPPSPWQSASLGPATCCVFRTLHTSPPSHFDPFGLFNAVTAVAERVQERFKDTSVLFLPPELPHDPMTGEMKKLQDKFNDLRMKQNRGAAVTVYVNCQEFPSIATQLARDFGGEYYSKERRLPKRSRVVATLDASSEDSLERSYYELAKRLNCDIGMYNLEVKTFTQNYEQRLSAIANEVKAKLRERAGWLLIIDNDNSNSALSTLYPLPGSRDWGEGLVLVTCSSSAVKKGNTAVEELIIEGASANRVLRDATIPAVQPPCSPVIARYADYLKAYYRLASIAPDYKLPSSAHPCNQYINLAVVKKERVSRTEADTFTKATLHGHINEVLRKKEPLELEDIFKHEGQGDLKCVLVEGAPGVGKSTLAWELCRRWEEMEAMRNYSVVVLLRLREKRVQEAETVADLFYHDDPSLQQAVAQEVVTSEGRGVLLILDGFDEFPVSHQKSSGSIIPRIIQGSCLPKATVLVTSRPSATADVLSASQVQKHVEVLGFTQEYFEQYARNAFASNPQLLQDFLRYISTNPAIRSMMYIPLNSFIAVEVYRVKKETGKPIPCTMTQLYTELILTLLIRYLNSKSDQQAESLPDKLEALPPVLYYQLFSLARLAFEGIVKQEVIFANLPDGCDHMGFMNASAELYLGRRASVSYNFLHLTLQEFLAAFYVSQLPANEQKMMFERYSGKNPFSHMDVMWKFMAGLTGFKDVGWELVQSRRGRRRDGRVRPILLQCLYEAQDEVACEFALGGSKVTFHPVGNIVQHLTGFDYFALGYCVAVSKCTWELNFYNKGLGAEIVEMLVCGLKYKAETGGSIERLLLGRNPIKQEGMAHIKEMPDNILRHITELSLPSCQLNGLALDTLSETIPTMTNLKELYIDGNPAGDGGTVKLLHALSTLSNLHNLEMYDTHIGCEDIRALSQLIRPSGCLKELWIGGNVMSPECKELMMETVLSKSSLSTLHFQHVLTHCLDFFTPLERNCNLSNLVISSCNVSISPLAKALHKNTTLRTLRFLYSQIGTDGAIALAEMLKVNKSLEVLSYGFNKSLGEDGTRALINALHHNHTLKEMMLPNPSNADDWHFSHEEHNRMDSRVKWF